MTTPTTPAPLRAATDEPLDSFLKNCVINGRPEDGALFFTSLKNTGIYCRLNEYAIIPLEQYRAFCAPAPVAHRPAEGWISVADQLPERWTEVLVYPRPTEYCCEAHLTLDGWEYTECQSNCGVTHFKCTVSHWMAMPADPKEDK